MPRRFEVEQQGLEELMHRNRAYAVSPYQCRYSWGAEENQRLWEDVVDCCVGHHDHFLGTLVVTRYKSDRYDRCPQADELAMDTFDVFRVVDGQQRLVSLTLILAALYQDMLRLDKYFRGLPDCDAQDRRDWKRLMFAVRSCLVTRVRDRHSRGAGGYVPRVLPGGAIYERFKTMVNVGSTDGRLPIERAYAAHVANVARKREMCLPATDPYWESAFVCTAKEVYDFYRIVFDGIATHMRFIRIECDANDVAFQVFDSLNGTGHGLAVSDRIRDVLMANAAEGLFCPSDSTIASRWSAIEGLVAGDSDGPPDMEGFLSALMFGVCGEPVPRKSLAKRFAKKYLRAFPGTRKALDDLTRAADLYGTIRHPDSSYRGPDGTLKRLDPRLRGLIEDVTRNDSQRADIPLLCVAMNLPAGFDDPLFERSVAALRVLLVRNEVCRSSACPLEFAYRDFCDLCRKGCCETATWKLRMYTTDDETFRRAFAELTIDPSSKDDIARARYYLREIEGHLRKHDGDGAARPDEDLVLERIIPQDFDPSTWFRSDHLLLARFEDDEGLRGVFEETVVRSIGNMCLLRRALSAHEGNGDFNHKLRRYCEADERGEVARDEFRLVGQIVDNHVTVDGESQTVVEELETFNAQSVELRARALADYALAVWPSIPS